MSFFKKTSTLAEHAEHEEFFVRNETALYGPQHPAMMAYATVARRTLRDHLENYVEVDPFAHTETREGTNVYTASKNSQFVALLNLFSEKKAGPFSSKGLAKLQNNDSATIQKARFRDSTDGIHAIYKRVTTNTQIATENFVTFYKKAVDKHSGLKSQFTRDKKGKEFDELRYALVIRAMLVGDSKQPGNSDTITAYQNIFNRLPQQTKENCGVHGKFSAEDFTGDDLQTFMKKYKVFPLDVLQGKVQIK